MPSQSHSKKTRAEADKGKGHGRKRYILFTHAHEHIERSLADGYYCEAIALIESVISDRLESRLAFLADKPGLGFKTLGYLVPHLRNLETDADMRAIIDDVDAWRERRNGAIHELVKVEDGVPHKTWEDRMHEVSLSASDGYEILKHLYNRVADLNPGHTDRVFPKPQQR